MIPHTFFVLGGNCPRSKEDIQTLYNYFVQNGFKPVKKIKKANIVCIYTCGGFNVTEKASIATIQRILQQKSKNAIVIATGCLSKINPASMSKFNDLLLIEFDKIEQLDSIIHSKIAFKQIPTAGIIGRIHPLYEEKTIKKVFDNLQNPNYIKNIPFFLKNIYFKLLNKKSIYHIRISRGCLSNCSYCSIKLAHRRLQSKPVEQIQKDFEIGLKKGYKKYKLIGEDVGCYGIDINTNIMEILNIFFNLPGNNKIIINDFNPQWFIKYFDELKPLLIKNHEKILDLRIPIQSGSNKILARMKRYYDIEEVKRCILTLKETIPNLKIYTHIIVGFPGETDKDFQQTLNLLKEIQFDYVLTYPYSDRFTSESFKLKEKISSEIIQERMRQVKLRYKRRIGVKT
jgi:MiaB/RimO family radical SAM methylthiotransferase